MSNETTIPAKATTPAEQSDSIVVSFGAEWHQQLLSKAFSLVIRKRIPKNSAFDWLYFHINSPVGAICGRAKIAEIVSVTQKEAVALTKQINLSPAEIKSYIGGDINIGCYKLGAFEFGRESVSAAQLATRLIYHPPQSFFILSKQAKVVVDDLCGFPSSKAAKSPKGRKP